MGKQFDMLLRGERPNFLANPDVLKRKNRLTE
jgi:hypothetical protein